MNAQIRKELLQLERRGLIKAEEIVEWARTHKKSALHSKFEWDDTKAAHEYRLWQARELLIEVVNEKGRRELVSLSIDRQNPGGGYRFLTNVMGDDYLKEIALQDALKELRRVQEKYQHLKELASVFRAVDRVVKKHSPKDNKSMVKNLPLISVEERSRISTPS